MEDTDYNFDGDQQEYYTINDDNIIDSSIDTSIEDEFLTPSVDEDSSIMDISTDEQNQCEPSFLGDYYTDIRDRKASSLENDLYYSHIHINGTYEYDSDHGGFDRSTGQKIHDAIDKARGEEMISDYTYKQLMEKLDEACYYQ